MRRRLLQSSKKIDFVDLGLPSGILWAKGNIINPKSGVYEIGKPSDYGGYASWGNSGLSYPSYGTFSGNGFSSSTYPNTYGG